MTVSPDHPFMQNPASWVVRRRRDGKVMCETFSPSFVAALNHDTYEAVPAYQHLVELNAKIKRETGATP